MGETLPISEFGFPGPLRDRLVAAILSGEKTTTTGLYEGYLREGEELTAVGARELVVDSEGKAVAVIETIAVDVRRVADVDLEFAIAEGEGFETVSEWREAHVRFFESAEMAALLGEPPLIVDDDTLEIAQRLARHRADRIADIVTAVVARDDDGKARELRLAHDFAGPRKSKSTPWSACSTSFWKRPA